MSLVQEFKAFAARGNVIDLAVAVVLGAAFTKIVTAMVDGLIMPIVGAILPGQAWQTWTVTPLNIKAGAIFAAIVDFLLIALVVFVLVNKLLKGMTSRTDVPPGAPIIKDCPQCLEKIPVAATRCRACAQPV